MRYTISGLSLISYFLTIPLYFILPKKYRSEVTAALLFSYPGVLLRHTLGVKLNHLRKGFPIGTFAANMLATVIIGICHTLQRKSSPVVGPLSCVMLQGLQDGLCGCLSTVSTFAVELRGLGGSSGGHPRRAAWVYAITSLGTAQILLLIVTGIPWWAGGISELRRCTFEQY